MLPCHTSPQLKATRPMRFGHQGKSPSFVWGHSDLISKISEHMRKYTATKGAAETTRSDTQRSQVLTLPNTESTGILKKFKQGI